MNLNEFLDELQELLDKEFSQFRIGVHPNHGQPTAVTGFTEFASYPLHIGIGEWKESESANKALIRHRLETTLEDMLEFITGELEELYKEDLE